MKDKKMIDLKPILDDLIDSIILTGTDLYEEFKNMIMAYTAECGNYHLLELWKKVFTEADRRKPLLLEMK